MNIKDLVKAFNYIGPWKAVESDGKATVRVAPGVTVMFDVEGNIREHVTRYYGDGDVETWLDEIARQLRTVLQPKPQQQRKIVLRKKTG